MRPSTSDIKNNGTTRTGFSCLRLRHFKTSTDTDTVFSFFLPTAHFGFDKPVLAIPNLAHLFLRRDRQKTNKLNSHRTQIVVLRTLFARALDAPKSAPQACGIVVFIVLFAFNSKGQINVLEQQRQKQNYQTQQNNNNAIHNQSRQNSYNQVEEAKTELKNTKTKKVSASRFRFVNANSPNYKLKANTYIKAYNELNTMLSTDTATSVKRAVYVVENSYLQNNLPYNQYLKLIQNNVELVKYILKKEKLDPTNPDAVHYAIQKLFSDTLYIKQANGTIKKIKPFHYDFNDPFGEKDQSKRYVTKLLATHNGQCYTMPLLYMIIADEFKIKSYIAYSPQHSYIKFQTKNGTWYNFETTNGRLTTDAFVLGSGFIKSEALKSNIFNNPNNQKQVVANMFIELANNYSDQFGYDEFQQKCVDKSSKYNPNYIYTKVVQANYQTALTDLALANENYPPKNQLQNYPNIVEQLNKRNALYDELDNLGFTTMPAEAYKQWLSSLKQQQEKQNSEDLKLKFKTQIGN
ncbi:MAG: hypothetical protein SFY56_14175 [Bacteroidota bacterium]|nr:hypothetical protein [Bacteroidota bacterium]